MGDVAWQWCAVAAVIILYCTRDPPLRVTRRWRSRMTEDEKTAGLAAMNAARRNLAPLPAASRMQDLRWDDALERRAQEWVDGCPSGHSPSTPADRVGENMAWGARDLAGVVGMWDAERRNVEAPAAGQPVVFSARDSNWCAGGWSNCGHFTQGVWADTQRVGCARPTASCGKWGDRVFVCNYAPAGNISGRFIYPVA
jgi:hypothetical protein